MQVTDQDFIRLRDFMLQNYGINLEKKKTLIEGRLTSVAIKKGFTEFSDYVDAVLNDTTADEISVLVSRLTTNYTYFMREEQHYTFLRDVVLPEWVPRIKDHDLRTWSAGCSSGEEAYTTAMLYHDYFGLDIKKWDTTILATDISSNILGVAKNGLYEEEKLRNLPATWKNKYFIDQKDGLYRILPEFSKEVVFGKLNLMTRQLPFKKQFHVIFCRNVMIYFNKQTREELYQRFYGALMPGGYLFIGLSETLGNSKAGFKFVKPSIYKKG